MRIIQDLVGLAFIFIVLHCNLKAQSPRDSTINATGWQQISAQESVAALKELHAYIRTSFEWEMDTQEIFFKKVLNAATLHQQDTLIFQYAYLLGNHFGNIDSISQAFHYYNLALEHAYNEGIKNLPYNNIGVMHLNVSDYNQALDYLFRAVETAKLLKDGSETYPLGNISDVYVALKDFEKAIQYTKLAIPFSYQLAFPGKRETFRHHQL